MKIICSPVGVLDELHPVQGLDDMMRAGFTDGVLDFSLFCSAYDLERYGEDLIRMDKHLRGIDTFLESCAVKGFSLPLAIAPVASRNTMKTNVSEILPDLISQCLPYCQRAGCRFLVVRPLTDGIGAEDLWAVNRAFYLAMADQARQYGVMILLENSTKNICGHLVRGACADGADAAVWVDQLNAAIGEERFGFCLNMEAASLCGQSLYELAVSLGHRLQVVFLSDCGGICEQALLPFSGACMGQSQTDWLGLIRGLRACDFDGMLVLAMRDTVLAMSPLLRPALLQLAKSVSDYIAWQIQMEQALRRYSSVVLFGAGNMCRNYMKCYGETYPPLFTCDNNAQRWGTEFCGLMVCSPEKLKQLPTDCVILICNVYYREIEEQLRMMGIRNAIAYFNDEFLPQFEFTRLDMGGNL